MRHAKLTVRSPPLGTGEQLPRFSIHKAVREKRVVEPSDYIFNNANIYAVPRTPRLKEDAQLPLCSPRSASSCSTTSIPIASASQPPTLSGDAALPDQVAQNNVQSPFRR